MVCESRSKRASLRVKLFLKRSPEGSFISICKVDIASLLSKKTATVFVSPDLILRLSMETLFSAETLMQKPTTATNASESLDASCFNKIFVF